MREVHITAYPYAAQTGIIEVPDGVDAEKYIKEHWNEVTFDEPELDYCGTDFDVWEDEEC